MLIHIASQRGNQACTLNNYPNQSTTGPELKFDDQGYDDTMTGVAK